MTGEMRPPWPVRSTRSPLMLAALAVTVLSGCSSTSTADITPSSASPPTTVVSAAQPEATPAGPSLPVPPIAAHASGEPPGRDDHPPVRSAPAAAAPTVALAYARAWVRRERPPAQWLAAIRPLCEPGFATLMATADPGNVPASRVTGAPVAVVAPGGGTAQYRVPTDAGTLTVTLTSLDGRWKIAGNDFANRS